METRSAKRKKLLIAQKLDPNYNKDIISDLPDDVLHHILFFLPIKSIAQTSILSKRWKSIWYSFPDLDFASLANVRTTDSVKKADSCILTKCIDQILALIQKRSDIRVLRFQAFLSFSKLNGLIRHAVKHNVQELDLEVSTGDYFNFPRSLLKNGGSLKVLRLKSRNQGFWLPPQHLMKEGFRSLSSLVLSGARLDQPELLDLFASSSFPLLKRLQFEHCFELEHLRINCSALEELILQFCSHLRNLEIHAAKLRRLKITDCFRYAFSTTSSVKINAPVLEIINWSSNSVTEEIVLLNLTSLQEASVEIFLNKNVSESRIRSVSNLIYGISNCRSLTITIKSVQILCRLCHFENLKSLELHTEINKYTISWIASFLRRAPIIHTITIKITFSSDMERRQHWNKDLWDRSNSGEQYWESQTQSLMPFLDHLKVVRLQNFTGCADDVSLAKFLLKHGKVLQQVFIIWSIFKPRDSLLREKIKSQMMGFSQTANIVFQSPSTRVNDVNLNLQL